MKHNDIRPMHGGCSGPHHNTSNDIVPSEVRHVEVIAAGEHGAAGSRVAASSAAVELGRRLLLAARAGDTAQVLELMGRGAPFSADWLGTSPLHLAAAHAHAATVAVLLRAGVSRDARTKVRRTPLHLAAAAGHAAVARLLLDAGAAVDCRDMLRMTPLHWAVQRGHAAAAAELLARGADPAAASKFHKTPRSLAEELRRDDLLRLIDDAVREREAARSVQHLVSEQMAEAPPAVPQLQAFDAVRRIQEIKPTKMKQQPERIIKTEIKTESSSTSVGASSGEGGAAARLLRAHGITLLPADHSTTVLNALHSGRTVVLSDAGKLMLKESGESPQAATSKPSPPATQANKSMVLTATPVKSPPKPGMKIFTLNNKLLALPKDNNKSPIKKIINPHDMQVKFVQLPADAKIISPAKTGARRAGVKIIMNKSNFNRLVAGAAPPAQRAPLEHEPLEHELELEHETDETDETDAATLRAQLAAARRALATLRAELRTAHARLAFYEAQHHT